MSTWRRMADATFKIMPHFMSEQNTQTIQEYLLSRGAKPALESDRTRLEFHHRPGGYAERAIEWPTYSFPLDQKKLIVDVDCVTPFLSELRQLRQPDFTACGLRFFYSKNTRYLLTLDHLEREQVMVLLEQGRREADERAMEFSRQVEDQLSHYYKRYKDEHGEPPKALHLSFPLMGRN